MELINGMTADDGMGFGSTIGVYPHRLYPFPYLNYFNRQPYNNPPFPSYYNDPALDAVKLKVTLGGDPAAWSDSQSFFNLGLLTPSQAVNPAVTYYATAPIYQEGDTISYQYVYNEYTVDDPTQKLRYSVANQGAPAPGAQTFYLPGVASIDGFFAQYNQIKLKGNPVWFELEYQENELKTNPDIYYSGYTSIGTCYSTNFNALITWAPGYFKRYVRGFIKKTASPDTCTVDDIIFGGIWTANDLGAGVYDGKGYIVINGVIRGSISSSVKPLDVVVETFSNPGSPLSLDELGYINPQYWSQLTIGMWPQGQPPGPYTIFAVGGSNFGPLLASDSLDIYNIKWVEYLDYLPDSGPGTPVGIWQFWTPSMATHPGYSYSPPTFIANPLVATFNSNSLVSNVATIYLYGTNTFPLIDVTVDWGDGNIDSVYFDTTLTHTYASDGLYNVSISAPINYTLGSFALGIDGWTGISTWGDLPIENLSYSIAGCPDVVSVPNNLPNGVVYLTGMFDSSLNFNDSNVSSWNTTNVIDMGYMFANTSVFNQSIGNWETGNVTDMTSMFNGATAFNQNLSNWCVTNIVSEPVNFATGSALTAGNKPVWGTCPP